MVLGIDSLCLIAVGARAPCHSKRSEHCHSERAQRLVSSRASAASRGICTSVIPSAVEGSAPAAIRFSRGKNDARRIPDNGTLSSMRTFYVYILASRSRTLYIGVTNDMAKRLAEHRAATEGFTARYRCVRLVFVEAAPDARAAITREKQLKKWRREKKLALIQAMNPGWDDLSEGVRGAVVSTPTGTDPSTRCARSG